MAIPTVRRAAVIGAAFALTLFHPSTTIEAQYVQAPQATETYGPEYVSDRDWSDDIPAHLSVVEGTVTLERDGRLEPAEANIALLAGDRLRTQANGRVEVLFTDGSTITIDQYSELDFLSESLVRLLAGQMRLSIARDTATLDYRVDAPSASVWIRTAGDYKISIRNDGRPEVLLRVVRGSAELVNEHGRTLVRAGSEAVATPDLAPSLPYAVNSASYDAFDRWAEELRDARVGATSVRYLPTELRYYSGAFETYGSWDYVAPHGYVWYPRVHASWRPYSVGRWSLTAKFGWFWVGIDRWSWPTHHYGRWGYSPAGWYWIPDRRWGPAWVVWGTAPGYVSWCPLGFDGRPVFGFRTAYYDPWRAWTVVPARSFRHNIWVTQHIVSYTTIAPTIRSQFTERRAAPVVTGYAAPRNSEPLRAPTLARAGAASRTRSAPPAGEEWREPRSTVGGNVRSNAAGTPSRTAVPRDTGRPTVGSTPAGRTDASSGVANSRSRAAAPADRGALPQVTDLTPRSRAAVPRGATAGDPNTTNAPRATAPRGDSRTIGEPDNRSRAIPRGPDPQVSAPPRTSQPSNDRPSVGSSRSAAPRTPPPPAFEPPRGGDDRSRSRAPSAGPSRPSSPPPPPSSSGGARSRGGVEAPRPSAPPPPQASQPSRSRGGDSTPPPSAGSPPSRGGGGGNSGGAAPRSRTGRGGGVVH